MSKKAEKKISKKPLGKINKEGAKSISQILDEEISTGVVMVGSEYRTSFWGVIATSVEKVVFNRKDMDALLAKGYKVDQKDALNLVLGTLLKIK